MNDALRMCGIQRVRHVNSDVEQAIDVQWAAGDEMLQSRAFEKLHRDESPPILLADVVNGADVRMVKRRSRLCLSLKAGQRLRILGHLVGQEL
jgi:hypothetical protein